MPTILGGGISGLSAGYYLSRQFVNPISIFDASNRLGGWVRSELHKDKGFIFETGPRTIRSKGLAAKNTLQLVDDLNLEVDPICAGHESVKNRMIYANGNLCMLPNSLGGLFKTIPPFTKPLISGLFQDLRTESSKQNLDDESIYDFVERRFGKEIAKYAISSMICGICAGDAKEISVRFLMNDIFEKEQKWGGITKGLFMDYIKNRKIKDPNPLTMGSGKLIKTAKDSKWYMYRIKGGIETLPKALESYLQKNSVEIKKNSECKKIYFGENYVKMDINGDTHIETEHVISAIPSYKLASLVETQHPSLAYQLKAIPYVDVAVVNLQYNVEDLLQHNAFGFLVPPVERLPILGVIFDSCCFDMRGNTVITVMMGGKWFQEYFGKHPCQKELLDIALANVEKILNIRYEPKLSRVHILRKCIPQYTVGHKARVQGIRNYIKNYKLPISLCGAAYDGVGVNDVVLSAKNQVHSLVEH